MYIGYLPTYLASFGIEDWTRMDKPSKFKVKENDFHFKEIRIGIRGLEGRSFLLE